MKKYKFFPIIFGTAILFLGLVFQTNVYAAPTDIVNIPDTNLKTYLNGRFSQPATADITEAQMATLTTVTLSSIPVANLTGMEYATSLLSFSSSNTQISDISPLANLITLDTLSVNSSPLAVLPDLHNLVHLRLLDLSSSKITTDQLLKFNHIASLERVRFDSVPTVTDISALAELPNLTSLGMQFAGAFDFTVINNFPKLTDLAAYAQNHGDFDPPSTIKTEQMTLTGDTIYLPYSLMPNRLTNFDGYQPPFTTSTSSSNTYIEVNGVQVAAARLTMGPDGVSISGFDTISFHDITNITFNTRYDNPAGSYATPPGFGFYSISAGIYYHEFNVDSSVVITADPSITYNQNATISESQFLTDIHAITNDGSPITSNFASVNFAVAGDYVVELNAVDEFGNVADPVFVTVTILDNGTPTTDNNSSDNNTSNNNTGENNLPITGSRADYLIPIGILLIVGSSVLFIRKK